MEVKGREVNKELPHDCLNQIFNLNPAYSFFFLYLSYIYIVICFTVILIEMYKIIAHKISYGVLITKLTH